MTAPLLVMSLSVLLAFQDKGMTYVCEAGVEGEFITSHSVYKLANNITVLCKKPGKCIIAIRTIIL